MGKEARGQEQRGNREVWGQESELNEHILLPSSHVECLGQRLLRNLRPAHSLTMTTTTMEEPKLAEAQLSLFDLVSDDELGGRFLVTRRMQRTSDDDLSSMLLIAESTEKARARALAIWNK